MAALYGEHILYFGADFLMRCRDMTGDFIDPTPEQLVVVLIDAATLTEPSA
jgi:hypothetical protein